MKIESASPVLEGYPVTESTLGHVEGFDSMPVVRWTEGGVYLSRLVLDEEARRCVAETGELYVFHSSFESRFPPIRVVTERPEYTLRVLDVDAGEGRRALFHGLEVAEQGGSEADRVDYAAAEAAVHLATLAKLPCRVALLRQNIQGMGTGGEECATAGQLEAALVLRLKRALDELKPVELRDAAGAIFKVSVAEMTPRACAGWRPEIEDSRDLRPRGRSMGAGELDAGAGSPG